MKRTLADPAEIKLQGSIRSEDMISSVGRIKLRWPRTVEGLFGRTPQRAMVDAARTVGRALKNPGFSPELQKLSIEWSVVFMDGDLPETQIPSHLIQNCHPGWMTPPANIYVVGQRVAFGCGNRGSVLTRVADADLARVLIHEMGHVLEHEILQDRFFRDRARAEGFATWFESYASQFSDLVRSANIREKQLEMGKGLYRSDFEFSQFSGSSEDYLRAALVFHAIYDRRNISGIMRVYGSLLDDRQIDFYNAIQQALGWNRARLNSEIERLLR